MKETGNRNGEASCYLNLGTVFLSLGEYFKAEKYLEQALNIVREIGHRNGEATCYAGLGALFQNVGEYVKAERYLEKALSFMKEIGDRNGEALCYSNLGTVFQSLGEYVKAEKSLEQALNIMKEIGERNGEASCYSNLGTVFRSQGEYVKAEKYLEQGLTIKKEIGDRNGEASCYSNLGAVFESLGEYAKAEKYLRQALIIQKEIGDKNGEAKCYVLLGAVFKSQCEYFEAEKYLKQALIIMNEIGDRNGEASTWATLGTVFHSLCEYAKAEKYLEQGLTVMKEIGNRNGEASCYLSLGAVFKRVGEYVKAERYVEQALSFMKEIGDRKGEALCYLNFGTLFESLGEYLKAEKYLEQALNIMKEIGDRNGEVKCYLNLGTVFGSLNEYAKAEKYLEQALIIQKTIGDRNGEASCYSNLGIVFASLGEYVKAEKYLKQALTIVNEIGARDGEADCCLNLGMVFQYVDEYDNSIEHFQKALTIMRGTGDRNGESSCYERLGSVFVSLRQYPKAAKELKKALRMKEQISDKRGEARCYRSFGTLLKSIGDYVKAEEYFEKSLMFNKTIGCKSGEADNNIQLGLLMLYCLDKHGKAEEYLRKSLELSKDSGYADGHFVSLCHLAVIKFDERKVQEAISYLLAAIQRSEYLRRIVGDNDQFKISFTEQHVFPYWKLSTLFCAKGHFKEALNVSELGRARALVDLMSAQNSVENQLSTDPQTWASIERIAIKESNCTCLYTSYSHEGVLLWILPPSGVVRFRKVNASNIQEQLPSNNLDEFFAVTGSFRSFGILPGEHCEDRSLNDIQMKDQFDAEDSNEPLRKNDQETVGPTQDLPLCYKLIIAPVADLLDQPEVIIVPDRALCSVPFAALPDENGKYFAEKYRIRYVPSLSTLKLIQDSPADYHSQTGALIVGNPNVGKVRLKGRCQVIPRLPCAENEAVMIGKMLGVEPLLGEEATKQAVLQQIHLASLIHFAAHGNPEKGEILLTPSGIFLTPFGIPRDEDFLLTVAEISKVQLRAKLVVLSCCHSARGKIKAEGVVGIARAFLGSGARSVLVALWALNDNATEHFMRRFYEHLVRGESASESLHEAMEWMRDNGYPDVRHWAPFVLIGDNVTFDFENQGKKD